MLTEFLLHSQAECTNSLCTIHNIQVHSCKSLSLSLHDNGHQECLSPAAIQPIFSCSYWLIFTVIYLDKSTILTLAISAAKRGLISNILLPPKFPPLLQLTHLISNSMKVYIITAYIHPSFIFIRVCIRHTQKRINRSSLTKLS